MVWTTEFTCAKSMLIVCEVMKNIEVQAPLNKDIYQIKVMTPIYYSLIAF
jgi:hypothetical protein